MHHLGALYLEPRAPQHVDLHGRIGKVLRLAAVRRLHFDHRVAPGRALQNVDPHVGLVREEPGLVDRRQVTFQGFARGGHFVVVLIEREIDQLAPGNVTPRALADFPPLREQVLLPRRRGQLRRLGLVHPPPQLLVTLQAGEITRLGEARGFRRHTRTVTDNSLPDVYFPFPVTPARLTPGRVAPYRGARDPRRNDVATCCAGRRSHRAAARRARPARAGRPRGGGRGVRRQGGGRAGAAARAGRRGARHHDAAPERHRCRAPDRRGVPRNSGRDVDGPRAGTPGDGGGPRGRAGVRAQDPGGRGPRPGDPAGVARRVLRGGGRLPSRGGCLPRRRGGGPGPVDLP